MRAVDADALIVQFRRAIETFLPNDPRKHMDIVDSLKCHGWQQGLRVIQDAPTIYLEPHWIPVTDGLPEVGENALLSYFGEITIGWLNSDGLWSIYDGWKCVNADEVSAWMPLPEKYED